LAFVTILIANDSCVVRFSPSLTTENAPSPSYLIVEKKERKKLESSIQLLLIYIYYIKNIFFPFLKYKEEGVESRILFIPLGVQFNSTLN
jgi:hypothetical protein